MRNFEHVKQRGAVLVVALVMLLVLTLLATSSMHSTALDARISGNRATYVQLYNLADAALREAELRLYGQAYVRDKVEHDPENCSLDNTLQASGRNKPCLLAQMSLGQQDAFLKDPIAAVADGAGVHEGLSWMPYRGLDAGNLGLLPGKSQSYWNIYRLPDGEADQQVFNPHYGESMAGQGTFFFLITGQADAEVVVQSTFSATYLGLE